MNDPGEFRLRVYYEDTDAGGIVYYANYLKFAERARTEALLALGFSQRDLRERLGVQFVVRNVHLDFWASAVLEDQLRVTTRVVKLWGARITMEQDVFRGDQILARCAVSLAAVGLSGRPTRVPEDVRTALAKLC